MNPPHPADAVASQSPPEPAGPPIAGTSVAIDWQHSLAAWLAAHKTYPEDARRRGTEGNVVLRFTADRYGRVLDVGLVHGSGSSVLDTAAKSIMSNAVLPAFPAGMSQDKITVTVQIRYALTD